jgi:alcohol dehydrogenase class IV
MASFSFRAPGQIQLERGAAARLAAHLQTAQRPLLITDAALLRSGLLAPALQSLNDAGLQTAVFDAVVADPPAGVIEAATAAAIAHRADMVIGFGGGSPMDVAKLVALCARSGEALSAVYGVNQARGPRLPLLLVPTTAGTGSEVTPIAIVTTGKGQKQGVVSPLLLPDLALLDAELLLGLPAAISAATGIDAMVHATEAYTSLRLKNPISDALALEALRLLAGALPQACVQGDDIEAREATLLGACLAGMAFANAPVAAVHALAYPVGARFHVPHGLSNALVLGPVLRFNAVAAAPLYAQLAPAVQSLRDVPLPEGEAARAAAFIATLSGLSARLGLPTRLREVGIQAGDLPQLADDAMLQTRLLINNPRPLTRDDALALYQEAF